MIFLSGSYIFTRIYNALAQREGKKVTLPTLVSVTGLTEAQIQSSIANARRTREVHARQIEVVQLGRVWKFKGDSSVGGYVTPDEVVKAVEVGSQHIWKIVLAALVKNVGKITSKELLAQLASTPEKTITPTQASQAMLTVMRQPGVADKIEVLWAGNAWRYREAKEAKEAKEQVTSPTFSETKAVSAPIRGSVLRYFAQHPGETLFRDDIAADLGFTVKQVQSAMWHLLNENNGTKSDFVIIQSSYAWQYVPNRAAVASTSVTSSASSNGHVTPELVATPAQAYTPAAATTTLPVSSKVPTIPQAAAAAAEVSSDERTATVATSGRLFEEIDQLADGALLLREAESNTIYRATKLG